MSWLVPLPVLLPLLGAALSVLTGRSRITQRIIGVTVLTAVLVISVVLLVEVDSNGPIAAQAGGWPASIGITLVADRLATIMLVVASLMLLAVLVFAIGEPGAERNHVGFQSVYLVLAAGVSLAFLTGDLFNLFVAFEMMLTASYVLLTLGGTRRTDPIGHDLRRHQPARLDALRHCARTAVLGDRHPQHGRARPPDPRAPRRIAERLRRPPRRGVRHQGGAVPAVLLAARQLPDRARRPSPPCSPGSSPRSGSTPSSALRRCSSRPMLGRRPCCWCSPRPRCSSASSAQSPRTTCKRILSFDIVSQVGYMVMGLALFTVAGVAAAVFYIVQHIIVKTSLFLTAGLIEHTGGSSRLSRLGGMVRTAPMLAVLFLLPALSLAGIPPLSGFIGKLALVEAGIASEEYAIVAVSLLVSLLTLFVMVKIWSGVFWSPARSSPRASTGSDEPVRRSAPHGRANRRPRHLRARRRRRRRTALRPERTHRARSPRTRRPTSTWCSTDEPRPAPGTARRDLGPRLGRDHRRQRHRRRRAGGRALDRLPTLG